jgi:hypothetical protein
MDIQSELEQDWPNLAKTSYKITSRHTSDYNCIAWAASEDDRWWSPIPQDDYYWPEGVPQEVTLKAFILAYQSLGFTCCEDDTVAVGYEKIAIYSSADGTPRHVARQLASGAWTSKLGSLEDIQHELAGVEGEMYGTVQQLMQREIGTPTI